MTHDGTWVSYGGSAAIVLAGVLAVTAAAVVFAGFRLPLPAVLPSPAGQSESCCSLAGRWRFWRFSCA